DAWTTGDDQRLAGQRLTDRSRLAVGKGEFEALDIPVGRRPRHLYPRRALTSGGRLGNDPEVGSAGRVARPSSARVDLGPPAPTHRRRTRTRRASPSG